MAGTEPPRCRAHCGRPNKGGAPAGNQNPRRHGFYTRSFDPDELADLVMLGDDLTLDDEIAAARVALRRVLDALKANGDLAAADCAKLAGLVFTGTRTVARLLRDERALSQQAHEGINQAIALALDELGHEWGLDL
jgi:hypothetical protein